MRVTCAYQTNWRISATRYSVLGTHNSFQRPPLPTIIRDPLLPGTGLHPHDFIRSPFKINARHITGEALFAALWLNARPVLAGINRADEHAVAAACPHDRSDAGDRAKRLTFAERHRVPALAVVERALQRAIVCDGP